MRLVLAQHNIRLKHFDLNYRIRGKTGLFDRYLMGGVA